MPDIMLPKLWGLVLTPPGLIIIVGLVGLFLSIWRRWVGGLVIGLALVTLFVFSVPLVGKRLLAQLETPFRDTVVNADKLAPNIQAIVVIGGGRRSDAPEYGGDTVSSVTLERLRYTAQLARLTGLPVLVSGGSVYGEETSEATLMGKALEQDFGVKPKWIEGVSRTTIENAQRSKQLLAEAGIRRVYLVTHAWHMNRAQWSFVEAGLDVVPAPTAFTSIDRGDVTALGYFPSATGLQASSLAIREHIGFTWYKSKRDAAAAADAVKTTEPAK